MYASFIALNKSKKAQLGIFYLIASRKFPQYNNIQLSKAKSFILKTGVSIKNINEKL